MYISCMCVLFFVNCYSPLHIAATSGLVGVVKELINRGADLNIRDADGMSYVIKKVLRKLSFVLKI